MAFTATTEWDVRTTGSDNNAGGFDTASTGTDYSQQDTPQVTYTDLVIGSTNTQLTSAAHPFTAAHVGNIINVTGGTGFTVQRVQIASVAGAVATCDKACGTASSTGGTGNLGGGLATIANALTLVVDKNHIHIKSGTYTQTTFLAMPSALNLSVIGYGTAHYDNGTRPLITTSTASIDPLIRTQGSGQWLLFQNLEISNTSATIGSCFCQMGSHWTSGGLVVDGSKIHGFTMIFNDQNAANFRTYFTYAFNSEFYGSQQLWRNDSGTGDYCEFWGCYVHDFTITGAGDVIGGSVCPLGVIVNGCVFTNSASGAYFIRGSSGTSFDCRNSVFYKCGGSAFYFNATGQPSQLKFENCIIYGSTTYAFDNTTAMPSTTALNSVWAEFMKNNGVGGSGTARSHNTFVTGQGEITLTADPFTAGATGNFSLNSVAGGGALLKAAGFNNTIPAVTNPAGKLDVGAVQTGGTGGGGSPMALRPSPIIRPM